MKHKLIFLTVLLTALSAFSTEYFVDASRPDDTGGATNWATAKKTIQAAVDLTANGDTVWVTNGNYTPIIITNAIFVRSVNGSDSTAIDGGGSRCASLANETVLEGFTLTNGVATTGGGVSGGTLNNCVLSGNRACLFGGPIWEGCNGGGAYNSTLNRCIITGNSANRGGGAYNCVLADCAIYSNAVSYTESSGWIVDHGQFVSYGGGVHSSTLDRCVLRGNSAGAGGGGAYESTLKNCLIIGNVASGGYGSDGGGGASDCVLGNCTVVENQAGSSGGGVFRCSATNSIIWSNSSTGFFPGISDVLQSSLAYSCTPLPQSGVGNITNSPLFMDEAGIDFRLQQMSHCVNSGANHSGMDAQFDLDGNERIHIGTVDMGAYEAQYEKAGQWIVDFLPVSEKMFSQDKTVSLSARGGNFGNPITFTNRPGSPVIWVNSTTIQFSAVGDVYIVAEQAESSNYYSATPVTNHYIVCDPGPFYVNAARPDNNGSGTSWETAKKTIQAAVDLAADGATVWVTNGIYAEGGSIAPEEAILSRVSILRDITVKSINGAGVTTIVGIGPFGSNAVRCAYLSAGAVLDGFKLTEGYTLNRWLGPAFDFDGLNETDKFGGGAFVSGSASIKNCVIVSNKAYRAGGGVFCKENGVLSGCLIAMNQVGTLEMIGQTTSVIKGDGGGVYVNGGGTINICTLYANCTELGKATLQLGNGGYGRGGGLYCYDGVVNNCIVANNAADAGHDIWIKEYSHPAFHNNAAGGPLPGQGNITNAPLFVDAANGDFRLQSGSPCVNWGYNSVVSNSTDLAGNPRIVEDTVDMGAYEYQGTVGLADSDEDGISDDWERQYGGNQNPSAVCSNGVNTILQAYIAGLDPKDPDSKFQTSDFRSLIFGNELQWQGVSGRVYAVYYSTNLMNGFQPLETNIPWSAGCFTDIVHHADGQLFYKLDVRLEDSDGSGGGGEIPPGDGGGGTPATRV